MTLSRCPWSSWKKFLCWIEWTSKGAVRSKNWRSELRDYGRTMSQHHVSPQYHVASEWTDWFPFSVGEIAIWRFVQDLYGCANRMCLPRVRSHGDLHRKSIASLKWISIIFSIFFRPAAKSWTNVQSVAATSFALLEFSSRKSSLRNFRFLYQLIFNFCYNMNEKCNFVPVINLL